MLISSLDWFLFNNLNLVADNLTVSFRDFFQSIGVFLDHVNSYDSIYSHDYIAFASQHEVLNIVYSAIQFLFLLTFQFNFKVVGIQGTFLWAVALNFTSLFVSH